MRARACTLVRLFCINNTVELHVLALSRELELAVCSMEGPGERSNERIKICTSIVLALYIYLAVEIIILGY